MLIYNQDARIIFPRYGIAIPSLDSRKTNTLQALLDDPELGHRSREWLIRDISRVIDRSDLARAHSPAYLEKLFGSEQERTLIEAYELIDENGDFNRYDPEEGDALGGIVNDVMHIISGTYAVVTEALDSGFCYFLGGGMHHAHPDFGHGFCLLNDICVALLRAREERLFRTAWVIDIDAHRGDGTAEIMADIPEIKTLSIHMASGWPLDSPEHREDGSLNPSWFPGDMDIPVESGEEGEYTAKLIHALDQLDRQGRPDLAFVVGGVDPYEGDELPSTASLNLTKEQMLERDMSLYQYLEDRDIPSAWVSAGGYGSSSWEIHTQFLRRVLKKRIRN